MKRFVFPFLMVLAFVGRLSAQSPELSISSGVIGARNLGYGSPFPFISVAGQVSPGRTDVGGGIGFSTNPKIATPGGHQRDVWGFGRVWLTPKFFASGELVRSHVDATIWTKDLTTAGIKGGMRLKNPAKTASRLEEMLFAVGYDQEVSTDATAPNRSHSISVLWQTDIHLKGLVFLRPRVSFSHVSFVQSGVWTSGQVSRIGAGIVLHTPGRK